MSPKRGKPLRGALCPECGGRLFPGQKPVRVRDVLLGTFDVHECDRCGESYLTARGWAAAEKAARAKGLFGIASEVGAHHAVPGTKVHA